MSEVQNNELFERDAATNALMPVLAAALQDGDVVEVRNGRLHKRDAATNALVPVVQVEGSSGGGGTVEIVDSLSSTDAGKALSANQGRVLDSAKVAKITNTHTHDRAYIITTAGAQSTKNIDSGNATGNSIVERDNFGRVVVGPPANAGEATPKVYVDNIRTALQTQITDISNRQDAMLGITHYLQAFDFGTSDQQDLQTLLTVYAQTQLGVTDIPNSVAVQNLFDKHEWIYNSATDEWVDNGITAVAEAQNGQFGIVQGSDDEFEVGIDPATKKMFVNGLVEKFEEIETDKLDKQTDASTIYAVSNPGQQVMLPYMKTAVPNAIPQRQEQGHLYVPETPTANNQAASKKYVDDHMFPSRTFNLTPQIDGATQVFTIDAAITASMQTALYYAGQRLEEGINYQIDTLAHELTTLLDAPPTSDDNRQLILVVGSEVTSGNVAEHSALMGRDEPDQHPMGAISGLLNALADTLGEAKSYTDNIVTRGNLESFDPDMGISSPNWDITTNYHAGDGVNHHYRGFTALTDNTDDEPYEGSPTWALEADDYVVGGSYIAWGGGTGASAGRGFIVVDGYGLYCVQNTTLTQQNIDDIIAALNALPYTVTFPIAQIGDWRVLYGWPQSGHYQAYFYSDGSMRWVDPRTALGVVDNIEQGQSAPVSSGGVFNLLINVIYPVGIITAFANAANPNNLIPGTAWQKLPDDTFLRSKATAGGTGGSNTITQILSHTHTLGAMTTSSAGTHKHGIRRDNSTPPGYLPSQANPQAIMSNAGNPPSHNGAFSDRAGTDYNNGAMLMEEAGVHTHTISSGTNVPAPAGAAASIDNQPKYLDVVYWKRTA